MCEIRKHEVRKRKKAKGSRKKELGRDVSEGRKK
jgi:hypothetical protein